MYTGSRTHAVSQVIALIMITLFYCCVACNFLYWSNHKSSIWLTNEHRLFLTFNKYWFTFSFHPNSRVELILQITTYYLYSTDVDWRCYHNHPISVLWLSVCCHWPALENQLPAGWVQTKIGSTCNCVLAAAAWWMHMSRRGLEECSDGKAEWLPKRWPGIQYYG